MSGEVTKYEDGTNIVPRTAAEIKAQRARILEIMANVMIKDKHYGQIPGTPKPTLYKPGAEMLLSTFHIAAEPKPEDITDLSTPDKAHYRVRVEARHMATGILMGAAVGECSSDEEKYKWRAPVCQEEFDEAPADMRREKWKKGRDGKGYKIKQVRTNPADVANTILQMAVKRAIVPVTRLVLACSDVFEQDLEDLPAEVREAIMEGKGDTKGAVEQPQKKAPGKVEAPKCPECGGPMWDNRAKKKSGDMKETAPDYKCRKSSCKGVYWPGQWPPKEEGATEGPAEGTTDVPAGDPEGCTKSPAKCDYSRYENAGEPNQKVQCGEGGPLCKNATPPGGAK